MTQEECVRTEQTQAIHTFDLYAIKRMMIRDQMLDYQYELKPSIKQFNHDSRIATNSTADDQIDVSISLMDRFLFAWIYKKNLIVPRFLSVK